MLLEHTDSAVLISGIEIVAVIETDALAYVEVYLICFEIVKLAILSYGITGSAHLVQVAGVNALIFAVLREPLSGFRKQLFLSKPYILVYTSCMSNPYRI